MKILRRELEAPLRARVTRDARALGVLSLRIDYDGWPDRVFLTPRQPVWLEFKRGGDGPRELQAHRLRQLRELGYNASWTDDYDKAMDVDGGAARPAGVNGHYRKRSDTEPRLVGAERGKHVDPPTSKNQKVLGTTSGSSAAAGASVSGSPSLEEDWLDYFNKGKVGTLNDNEVKQLMRLTARQMEDLANYHNLKIKMPTKELHLERFQRHFAGMSTDLDCDCLLRNGKSCVFWAGNARMSWSTCRRCGKRVEVLEKCLAKAEARADGKDALVSDVLETWTELPVRKMIGDSCCRRSAAI